MKRSGFKTRGKPLQAKKRMRQVSAKKATYRRSNEGQAALAYMMAVKGLPCAVCRRPPPSDAHHVCSGRYGSRKSSDFSVIPLCGWDHQDGPDAIHNGKRSWEEKHGPDYGYIKTTRAQLPPDILALIPEDEQ